jgi:hypothetical protein
MSWSLQQYQDSRGSRPVEAFLEALSETERAAVKAKLFYLQERGNQLSAHSPNYGNVSSNLPCPSFSKRGSPPFAKGRWGGIFVAEFMNRST